MRIVAKFLEPTIILLLLSFICAGAIFFIGEINVDVLLRIDLFIIVNLINTIFFLTTKSLKFQKMLVSSTLKALRSVKFNGLMCQTTYLLVTFERIDDSIVEHGQGYSAFIDQRLVLGTKCLISVLQACD